MGGAIALLGNMRHALAKAKRRWTDKKESKRGEEIEISRSDMRIFPRGPETTKQNTKTKTSKSPTGPELK